MNEIDILRNQLSLERRHMAEVENALAAAIDAGLEAGRLDEFCRACATYLRFIGERFSRQERTHCELLRPRLAPADAANRRVLDELEETLRLSGPAIAALAAALQRRESGACQAAEFLAACRDYVEFLKRELGQRRHVIHHLFERHYRVAEWRRASCVDADSILEERELYEAVRSKLPPGIVLESARSPG